MKVLYLELVMSCLGVVQLWKVRSREMLPGGEHELESSSQEVVGTLHPRIHNICV